MGKKKDKKFSIMNIEVLVVIVLVAIMIIIGLFLFNIFTTSQKVKNLKEEGFIKKSGNKITLLYK